MGVLRRGGWLSQTRGQGDRGARAETLRALVDEV